MNDYLTSMYGDWAKIRDEQIITKNVKIIWLIFVFILAHSYVFITITYPK